MRVNAGSGRSRVALSPARAATLALALSLLSIGSVIEVAAAASTTTGATNPSASAPPAAASTTNAAATPMSAPARNVRIQALGDPVLRDIPRIGLNLGARTSWGAEQLTANVLKNPGLEAPLDRTLVVVHAVDGRWLRDDTTWLARSDGFWDGGRFDVRTGAAAGATGRILASRRGSPPGGGAFELDPMPAGLRAGDAVAVAAAEDRAAIGSWWIDQGKVVADRDTRPGSPGRQSARLAPVGGVAARLSHHLDTIGARAGKLLPVQGAWRLSFWARGARGGERLDLRFLRHGRVPFVARSITVTADWQRFEFPFDARDDGPVGPLQLSFEVRAGDVLIDDVYLGETQPGPGGFRRDAVAVLRTLRPGYLRDWQGQLGDSIANRLAEPYARRPSRYRPGDAELFSLYGLPEFFELCEAVGAQPWIVAPTLLGDDEWRAFGAALMNAARRHGFREIIVEFGNENWNPLFRPAGFLAPEAHAQAADRAFGLLRDAAGTSVGIVPLVNAQFANPPGWARIARGSALAQKVAVAPYFLHTLNAASKSEAVAAAFAESDAVLREGIRQAGAQGKGVAVYEVNFHTTAGSAPTALRDFTVTGAHSAAALARRLLQSALAGVREQAVYSLAGFDSQYGSQRSLVRLWGVARDLAPGTLRPTGLALALMNDAIDGDLRAARCTGPHCDRVTAAFFGDATGPRLVVASASPGALTVRTALPCARPARVRLIDGSSGLDNERAGGVAPAVAILDVQPRCDDGWSFDLPPYSLAVLDFEATGQQQTHTRRARDD